MPTLILGFGVGLAAIFRAEVFWCEIAAIMILSGGGDFLIIFKILMTKSEKKDCLYCDHPYECGSVLFQK